MKRIYAVTISVCLLVLAVYYGCRLWLQPDEKEDVLCVGFVYDGDESTSYTYNFSLASDELKHLYGDRIEILTRSNVLDDTVEESLRDLVRKGCRIIFLNGYSPQVMALAPEFPDVQFCQASWKDLSGETVPANYHTFKGEAYQARYVSGIAAGMVLRQLIDRHLIQPSQAQVGYVAAFADPEVISGYTAFLLGIRSAAPEAVMRVRYTHSWSSFSAEKQAAEDLIEEGCMVLSQHTDTIGPAIACEEAALQKNVYYVSYNQSMMNIAPRSALITARINWTPYITGAVDAVLNDNVIESTVKGKVRGNDMSAGFDQGWVEVMDLNSTLAVPGTKEKLDEVIAQFRQGNTGIVFRTDARAVSSTDPAVSYDLKNGYAENESSSYSSFSLLLPDIITIEGEE